MMKGKGEIYILGVEGVIVRAVDSQGTDVFGGMQK